MRMVLCFKVIGFYAIHVINLSIYRWKCNNATSYTNNFFNSTILIQNIINFLKICVFVKHNYVPDMRHLKKSIIDQYEDKIHNLFLQGLK